MPGIRPPFWVGYVAVVLLLGHAMLSYYWAAGGVRGLGLLSDEIHDMAEERETWFISLVWGVALLKTILAAIVLALLRDWRLLVPRWVPLLIIWTAGGVLTLYALLQFAALVIGGLVLGTGEQATGFWAYLLLWAPLWMLIGLSLLMTAWRARINGRKNPS